MSLHQSIDIIVRGPGSRRWACRGARRYFGHRVASCVCVSDNYNEIGAESNRVVTGMIQKKAL